MKTALAWLKFIAAIVFLIALGEIPPVHLLSDWINMNRAWILPLTLSMAGVGLVVMIWGWIVVGIHYGRSMTPEEAKEFMGQPLPVPGRQSFAKGRFRGIARGRKTDQPVEWSFREMKDAWRAGTWWSDRIMRRKYFVTAGGLLLILGGFSVFLVLMKPPAAQLLMAGTLVYVIARTVISIRQA